LFMMRSLLQYWIADWNVNGFSVPAPGLVAATTAAGSTTSGMVGFGIPGGNGVPGLMSKRRIFVFFAGLSEIPLAFILGLGFTILRDVNVFTQAGAGIPTTPLATTTGF